MANKSYKRDSSYQKRQRPRTGSNYIQTTEGPLKWCEVLSTEGYKHCTLEFCSSPHRRLAMEDKRQKRKKRPHSFPRLWWDKKKGQPLPWDQRPPLDINSRKAA